MVEIIVSLSVGAKDNFVSEIAKTPVDLLSSLALLGAVRWILVTSKSPTSSTLSIYLGHT